MKKQKNSPAPAITEQSTISAHINDMSLKNYFTKVVNLHHCGDEFPVDLDKVWPLVYTRKDEAVRELLRKGNLFMQGLDYQIFHKNVENSKRGRPTENYKISVKCMEFLVARKNREVFEVYRQVFHQAMQSPVVALDAKIDKTRHELYSIGAHLTNKRRKLKRLKTAKDAVLTIQLTLSI